MKQNLRFTVFSVLTLFVLVLSACGATAPAANLPVGGADKAQSAPVEFTGTIQAINGNQWTVNGQQLVVDAQALGGAPAFNVGDTVHIKGTVAQDGTVNVSGMDAPKMAAQGFAPASAQGLGSASAAGDVTPDPSATPDPLVTPDPSATPDPSGQQELVGVIEAINGDQVTIDGVTYTLALGVDISAFVVGDTIKIHFVTNTDGTLTITEIQNSVGGVGSDDDDDTDDDSDDDDSDDDDSDDDDSDDDDSDDSDDDD